MNALACACLLAFAAAGCAADDIGSAAGAGATAPGFSARDAEARRDSRDSRPGSREMEEAN